MLRKAATRRVNQMSIKIYNPTTNARRNMSVTDYTELSKNGPERSLLAPLNKNSGRNSYGRITVRHRGGGNRKKYKRRNEGSYFHVIQIQTQRPRRARAA